MQDRIGLPALADVRTGVKTDVTESYFLAEAMKYFYLLFEPHEAFDFERPSSTPRPTQFVAPASKWEKKRDDPMALDENSIEVLDRDAWRAIAWRLKGKARGTLR